MTDPDCEECEGTGFVDYLISVDDTRKMACELCNDGGDEPDEDEQYERFKDDQMDMERAEDMERNQND